MRVAVVGGSGFVGTRLLETWLLRGRHEPRLLVRQPSSLARVARFALPDWRQVDVLDPDGVAAAIAGCEVMVHAMVGTPDQIVMAATAAREACLEAGVRRLVYLSSASVHGQNPPAGTHDLSTLRSDQLLPYNNAKVRAEQVLSVPSSLEIAVLRPGVVYGPRCQWFAGLPGALAAGRAYLVEGGHGICNHIYVDNLVHAIDLAIDHDGSFDGPLYVGDDRTLTWREFYRPVAAALGYELGDFVEVPRSAAPGRSIWSILESLPSSWPVQMLLPRVSARLKRSVKAGLSSYNTPLEPTGFRIPATESVTADWETSELHTCSTGLSWQRARDTLGYVPPVDATTGLARTSEWLATQTAESQAPVNA
jgi:2-alkyl-3-oxoalkanoate reductase